MRQQNHSNEIERMPWVHIRVPPFPQIALRVMELMNDEGVSMCRLADLISSDPAFSSEVITVANSALVAHHLAVTSARQAVALLGTHSLKGVCLTVGVRSYLGKSMSYPSIRAIWRHSLACALISQQLALAGWVDKETAYSAGIMHEIGRFALAVLFPKEYSLLLETHRGDAQSILDREKALFGFDHCEVGSRLVVDWKLPQEFEPIMWEQNSVKNYTNPWNLAELIHISSRMADTAGFTAFSGCEVVPFSDLLSQLPIRERSLFHADIRVLADDIEGQIRTIESF